MYSVCTADWIYIFAFANNYYNKGLPIFNVLSKLPHHVMSSVWRKGVMNTD